MQLYHRLFLCWNGSNFAPILTKTIYFSLNIFEFENYTTANLASVSSFSVNSLGTKVISLWWLDFQTYILAQMGSD